MSGKILLVALILILAYGGDGANVGAETSKTAKPVKCGRRFHDQPLSASAFVGVEAKHGAFPWQVIIQYESREERTWKSFCGGTIISDRHIITAAHCLVSHEYALKNGDPGMYRVVAGEYNLTKKDSTEQYYTIADFRMYRNKEDKADYFGNDNRNINNDIAILKINGTIKFGEFVQPACLPFGNDKIYEEGTKAIISGWGTFNRIVSSLTPLRAAEIAVVDFDGCNYENKISKAVRTEANAIHFGAKPQEVRNGCIECIADMFSLTENMFCAGKLHSGIDRCLGDSGGPLMVKDDEGNFVLAGVVSFGQRKCYTWKDFPDVYTKVSNYEQWIKYWMKRL